MRARGNRKHSPAGFRKTDEMARRLIHAYYACVSFADAQIGRVLNRLEQTGEADNTIVVLWGDHGWQLGEHAMWCKHSTFETSMQVPLIVRAPGIEGNRRTRGLIESRPSRAIRVSENYSQYGR